MGAKGEASRAAIVEAARTLFAEKGFAGVSMSDLCAATGLSRGGLYRHFSSTQEIFAELVRAEQRQACDSLARAKAQGVGARRVLDTFLRARLSQLLDPQRGYDRGEPSAQAEGVREILAERAQSSVCIVADILRWGVERGEFRCADPEATASHILWLLEGMARHNVLLPLTPGQIDAQLVLLERLWT